MVRKACDIWLAENNLQRRFCENICDVVIEPKAPHTMTGSATLLIIAGLFSAIAALLHIGILYFGAPWYQFFGAGKRMVRLAEAGNWFPPMITLGIAIMLSVWSLYALSAAGVVARLPWDKPVLSVITAIYLLRGFAAIPIRALLRKKITPFWLWSSAICSVFGLVHLAGLSQRWSSL